MLLCAVAGSGCLLPTNLVVDGDPPNQRPVFETALVMPPFGPLTLSSGTRVDFVLFADDPNPMDMLHVRLFLLGAAGPSSRIFTGEEERLDYANADDANKPPYRRTGSLYPAGVQLCANYPNGGTFYAVVADRPFCIPDAAKPDGCQRDDEVPGGLSDENHWEVTCQ